MYDAGVSAASVGGTFWLGLCCLDSPLESHLPTPGEGGLPCSSVVTGNCPTVGAQRRSYQFRCSPCSHQGY